MPPGLNGNGPPRMSFAQVAAAANKLANTKEKPAAAATSNVNYKEHGDPQSTDVALPRDDSDVHHSNGIDGQSSKREAISIKNGDVDGVTRGMETVSLSDSKQPENTTDQTSRREFSDTKSIASRTAFQVDEKESLRPDDSASMRAPTEESPPESEVANSRPAQDPDVQAFRDQLNAIDRTESSRLYSAQEILQRPREVQQAHANQTTYTPAIDYNGLVQPALPTVTRDQTLSSNGLVLPPDDKLKEALASPKDRLFVLKIEQDMIDFIKDSKEHELQLPQTNSFYRMLSHKLAEYYFLGHVYDEAKSSVRVFKLPYSKLPPPLPGGTGLGTDVTGIANTPARMIMRRSNSQSQSRERVVSPSVTMPQPDGSARDSAGGSGSDEERGPKEKSAMTREEREARYNEARERIFRDFKSPVDDTAGASSTPDADASRASSTSGVKKNRKQRKPKDDTFEARSAYSQFGNQPYVSNGQLQAQMESFQNAFANTHFSAQAPSFQPSPPPHGMQPTPMQSGWSGQQDGPSYHFSPQNQYLGNPGFPAWSSTTYNSQLTPRPEHAHLSNMNQGQYGLPDPSAWQQPGFPYPYPAPSFYGDPNVMASSSPYPPVVYPPPFNANYGAFASPPAASFGPSIPNYNMPNFNPQTQAFIPHTQQPSRPNSYMQPGPYTNCVPASQPPQRQMPNQSFAQGYGMPQPFPLPQSPNNQAHRPANSSTAKTHSQTASHQNSGIGANKTPRQSSIAKFESGASGLPAKPPPTSSTLAFQVPRYSETTQPLPANPFASSTGRAHHVNAGANGESGQNSLNQGGTT